MKRWALVTVLLYAAILVLLTVPVLWLGMGDWWGQRGIKVDLQGAAVIFKEWAYWVWLGVMLLGAALMLVVPVDVSQKRFVPRRKLLVPVITAAFFLAVLVVSAAFAIGCTIFGDEALESPQFYGKTDAGAAVVFFGAIALLWLMWAVVFHWKTKSSKSEDAAGQVARWLLRGSILELLVAIPSHVIVRNKDVCCAPAASFWGITTGLTVMLLCFGPGVFFLFAERFARKRPPIDAAAGPQ